MGTIRQEKFSRLIQKELGSIFIKEGKKLFGDAIISVTRIIASPDLGHVKIYLNFINVKDTNAFMERIRDRTGEIKWILGKKIKNEIRKMPDLAFYYDDTLDYMEKMDQIFEKINKDDQSINISDDKE